MAPQKILITGCSGFIGSNLSQSLCEQYQVTGLDLVPPRFFCPDAVVIADVRNRERMTQIIRQYCPDYLIHLAAVSTIQQGALDPAYTRNVNVDGTRSVLEAAEISGRFPKIIFTSTDKVYGCLGDAAKYTEDFPVQPLKRSPYDASKAEADLLAQSFASRLPVTILRLCNIYGPCDTHAERVVPANIRALLSGHPGKLNRFLSASGKEHNFFRDMLYVSDLCSAFSLLLQAMKARPEKICREIFNIGALECCSMEQVVKELQQQCGCPLPPEIRYVETERELERQSLDYQKAKNTFGYCPTVRLSDGLERTVNWWTSSGLIESGV